MNPELLNRLKTFNQEHLAQFTSELSGGELAQLENDIEHLEFENYNELLKKVEDEFEKPEGISPVEPVNLEDSSDEDIERWINLGIEALSNGEVAAFLLAGGQGSRLGFDGPKGQFKVGLPSDSSLFELQAKRIRSLAENYNTKIPWFVMTSAQNDEQTQSFFRENNYWGLASEDVVFFQQGLIPAISFDGKILLENKSKVNRVPDGNGGCFKAFGKSGALKTAQDKGIKHIFVYGVDNALVNPCDPLFVGFHIDQKVPTSSKVVSKNAPDEPVGIFIDSKIGPGVIEYSDLPTELSEEVNDEGVLVYRGANIATHLFTIEALESAANDPLPYHVARKKISFINREGSEVKPQDANAYKFEQFLFDVFPRLEKLALLEVVRENEFAPVKNADGKDSPLSAREMLLHRDTEILYELGYEIKDEEHFEINPLHLFDLLEGKFKTLQDALKAKAVFSV